MRQNLKAKIRHFRVAFLLCGTFIIFVLLLAPLVGAANPGIGRAKLFFLIFSSIFFILSKCPDKMVLNAVIFCISTIFAFLIAEVALRFTDFGRSMMITSELDDRLVYKYRPRSEKYVKNTETGIYNQIKINERGYRGGTVTNSGAYRIAVIGDSFIAAEYSAEYNTFAAHLQRLFLNFTGKKIDIIPFGVPGYGPGQYVIQIENIVALQEADAILVAFYSGNDFSDPIVYRQFKVNSLNALEWVGVHHPNSVKKEFLLKRYLPLSAEIIISAWINFLQPNSDTIRAVRQMAPKPGSSLEQNRLDYESLVLDGNLEPPRIPNWLSNDDVLLEPDSKSAVYAINLVSALIQKIRFLSSKHSIPIYAMVIPDKFSLSQYNLKEGSFPEPLPPQRLVNILKENGLPVLDLSDIFHSSGYQQLYFTNDSHWNDKGQYSGAEAAMKWLSLKLSADVPT